DVPAGARADHYHVERVLRHAAPRVVSGPEPSITAAPAVTAPRPCGRGGPSHQHHSRLLQEVLERLEEARAGRAIHHAMVAAHGHAHPRPHHDLAVLHHRLLLDLADGEDP